MAKRRVREIIQRDRPLVGHPEDTVGTAAARMAQHRCGSILVCEDDRLHGIFTERDLLARVVAGGRDPATTRLAEVMTPDPDTLFHRSSRFHRSKPPLDQHGCPQFSASSAGASLAGASPEWRSPGGHRAQLPRRRNAKRTCRLCRYA
jgi:CBS domain-containing protein